MTGDQVIRVRGEAELVARAGHLFGTVGSEFLCAANDMSTWSRPNDRAAVAQRMGASLAEGVTVRKLYTPTALTDEAGRHHLFEVAAVGALVRVCASPLPHETIVIDRRVMILADPVPTRDRGFTVTSSPSLIEGVCSLLDAVWQASDPLDVYLRRDRPRIDADQRKILRALAEGLTDETAARRLGVSLRTYRRRVAELLASLESASRFQAGARAGELGLTR
ncbi:helix-turn-helix domain-containing protein [Nocardiopsis sp. CT-R113]|uniref:Helix-turn-helix domain-containing protein n=1 Tax=Nocardiopsis codii TaxID=3065942 RepID=A0ABU7K102_9ACTN|nr:helix-turn-helix domain-containing protein [Nocardiopsis sp. CT-R113]MEE2035943.1 helix-turn-helix domain-containing protein [Nocardiopsis sp. CT-R113]